MDNTDECIRTLNIGLFAAHFLLNTSRVLQSIKLCKEVLMLLNNTAQENFVPVYMCIYTVMSIAYGCLDDLTNEKECLTKLLDIHRRLGLRTEEGEVTCRLAKLCALQSKYKEAKKLYKKSLSIALETGDINNEATCYRGLGFVHFSLFELGKAEEYLRKEISIRKEIGDKSGEAECYGNMGAMYIVVGEYKKSQEYLRKTLEIAKEIGDKRVEAICYATLGALHCSLGKHGKAEEYQIMKELEVAKEIGDKPAEAFYSQYLGFYYKSLGEYGKAEEYQREVLALKKAINDKHGEAKCYGDLGSLCCRLGKHSEAKEYHEKALAMSRKFGDVGKQAHLQAKCHFELACNAIFSEGNADRFDHETVWNLLEAINKLEKMRGFLGQNNQFKVSISDQHSKYYRLLAGVFCLSRQTKEALCVVERERARALADLISGLQSAQKQTSADPPSWADIERILKKQSNCSCLYISHYGPDMFLWVLEGNKPIHFREIDVNECFVSKAMKRDAVQVFSEESFRRFKVLPQEHCEDRSLSSLTESDSALESAKEGRLAVYRPVEEEEEENLQPLPTLSERYRMIISPVADLLDQPELIIVPDPALFKVPFAALTDESGSYLSEDYRIRIAPSLTTLGLIQDSPADYHSQTGALIVGEPDVRDVSYKGSLGVLCRLPAAKEEAEMIGKLIGVKPLLGKQATKEAVLQSIPSVSLIHFAAHGDAERGEIALAPRYPINGIPTEKDYLLTMNDISEVQLRAKLVVLSCCHSAQGRVRAEGVVGIARAFLGSGARSVLAALWPLPDEATKTLMSRFYEHLVRGESASESLHQAMKWMRNNGYSYVRDWAPFMLIGDNVTFDFGK